ncbi:MAG: exopolysaccharide biosynthesis polyprenyl glycosylphosphotransferase [Sandaracinaceae bacterium]
MALKSHFPGGIPTPSSVIPVADLLLAAAHIDNRITEYEQRTVRQVLQDLLHTDELPPNVEARLAEFDFETFDLAEAVSRITERPPLHHRMLLELARAVCAADGIVELKEDAYLVTLVLALRGNPKDYKDLLVHDPFGGLGGVVKRAEDLLLGGLALAVLAAPLAAIALAVRLDSEGPVIFQQRRYGLDGEEFRCLKFRTMTVTEDGPQVKQATKDDKRITRVGAFLRRTNLDELPQLLNVLRGEMSLVGPRPHAVAHNEKYRELISEYMLRHKVRPGITGWAQVNGWRGQTDTLEKMVRRVEHDLYYIRHWSPWLDLKCLFLTVFGRRVWKNAY